MSSVDSEHFRAVLLEERQRVQHAITSLRDEHSGSLDDEVEEVNGNLDTDDLGDTASATLGREIDYTLGANSEAVLAEIDAALQRIEDGTYGICTNRGEEIPVARLEAQPWAALCIDCQRLAEA